MVVVRRGLHIDGEIARYTVRAGQCFCFMVRLSECLGAGAESLWATGIGSPGLGYASLLRATAVPCKCADDVREITMNRHRRPGKRR